jgi:hypothetical protein
MDSDGNKSYWDKALSSYNKITKITRKFKFVKEKRTNRFGASERHEKYDVGIFCGCYCCRRVYYKSAMCVHLPNYNLQSVHRRHSAGEYITFDPAARSFRL